MPKELEEFNNTNFCPFIPKIKTTIYEKLDALNQDSWWTTTLFMTQQTFTLSKLTVEALDVVPLSLLLTLRKFHIFSDVSIVNFILVNFHWNSFLKLFIQITLPLNSYCLFYHNYGFIWPGWTFLILGS